MHSTETEAKPDLIAWHLDARWAETAWAEIPGPHGPSYAHKTTYYIVMRATNRPLRKPRLFNATDVSIAELDATGAIVDIRTPGTMGTLREMLRDGDAA